MSPSGSGDEVPSSIVYKGRTYVLRPDTVNLKLVGNGKKLQASLSPERGGGNYLLDLKYIEDLLKGIQQRVYLRRVADNPDFAMRMENR